MIQLDSIWDKYIDPRWLNALSGTPFLQRAERGIATREELYRFASQHYHYARHFTRYLCALIANMENEEDRRQLTENLFEEMGLGDLGEIPHSLLYKQMLTKLGIEPNEDPPLPQTQALVSAMSTACAHHDPLVGLGALCLGAEAIVPFLYSRIIRGFEAIGTSAETLRFFTIHVAHDDDHAKTMKAIIDRALCQEPSRIAILKKSAEQVIQARVAMLASIRPRLAQTLPAIQGGYVSGLQL